MIESNTPEVTDPLLREGNRTLLTLQDLEPGLGIQFNTPAKLTQDLVTYRNADLAYQTARNLRINELSPEQRRLDREARAVFVQTKSILKPVLGANWSHRWKDAGFLDDSIATPKTLGERISLLKRLGIYLKANPQFEVEKLGVTSVNAVALFNSLNNVRESIEKQEVLETQLSGPRKGAAQALRKRLSALTKELGQVLSDDDERWHTFGLASPAERLATRRNKAKAKQASAAGDAETSKEAQKEGASRAASPASSSRQVTAEGVELNS